MTDLLPPPTSSSGDPGDDPALSPAAIGAAVTAVLETPVAALSGGEAGLTLCELDRLQALIDHRRLLVTRRFVESGDWAIQGSRSAKSWLVNHTDVSAGQASRWIRTGRDLEHLPATAASSAAGRIGFAKIALLAAARTPKTREAFDREEATLVHTVEGLTVDGARWFLRTWQLQACPDDGDLGDPERDHLHITPGFYGRGIVDGEYCPTNTAILLAAVEARIDLWHRQGLLDNDTRTRSELFAAALLEIVKEGADRTDQHRDLRPLILATVDHRTLARIPIDDADDAASRRCELITPHRAIPVPVETIHRLLCDGDVCRVVHNGTSMPLDVGRRERLATADQWRALIAVSGGTCEFHGCDAPHTWCQAHHPEVWNAQAGGGGSGGGSSGGETKIENPTSRQSAPPDRRGLLGQQRLNLFWAITHPFEVPERELHIGVGGVDAEQPCPPSCDCVSRHHEGTACSLNPLDLVHILRQMLHWVKVMIGELILGGVIPPHGVNRLRDCGHDPFQYLAHTRITLDHLDRRWDQPIKFLAHGEVSLCGEQPPSISRQDLSSQFL